MDKKESIGVFDSGIGGTTVLKEIIKILPNENYIYYSDSKNNPYGDKNNKDVIILCDYIVKYLLERKCKAIVIACNTASAKAAKFLREKYNNIPIIAIEPAYKMVHDFAYEKTTLIMATKGTIESEKFNLLYNKYDNHRTHIMTCQGLADIIEEGNQEKIFKYLQNKISIYKGKVENVVLGCTHYPLIKNDIKKILGNVNFFDGSAKVAEHLKNILYNNNILGNNKGNIEFIDSQGSEEKKQRFFNLLEA